MFYVAAAMLYLLLSQVSILIFGRIEQWQRRGMAKVA